MLTPAPFGGPLFLVGMPRSGTKLLRDLLNNHPAIGIPAAETEFLPDWAQRWPEFGDLSDRATFQAFAERQAGSPYFVYLREEQGHQLNIDAWYAACTGFGTAAVFEALIRTDAASPRGSGRIWGDKSPGYVQHIALLNRLWPACRVIHIVRDVRDYALSIDQAWGKDRLRAAQRWVDRITRLELDAANLGSRRFIELRYEDLVRDPGPELARLCTFLDLPTAPGLTQLKRPSENKGDARGHTAIKADNTAKYKAKMDPAEIAQIERLAGPLLQRFAYPCDHKGPAERLPPYQMAARQLKDGVNLLRAELKERGPVDALALRWRTFQESGAWEPLR